MSNLPLTLCAVTILLAVLLGNIFKLNIGIIAMACAFLIGGFALNMSMSEIMSGFPLTLFFTLVFVSFFYGYAMDNGAFQHLADTLLARFKKLGVFFPMLLFAICFVIAFLGAGASVVTVFMAPLAQKMGRRMGMSTVLTTASVGMGAMAGSNFTYSYGGILARGVIETTALAGQSVRIATVIFINGVIVYSAVFLLIYFICGGTRLSPSEAETDMAGRAMTREQKISLALIGAVFSLVIIPAVINFIAPNALCQKLVKSLDITVLSMIGIIICSVLKLGDTRRILKNIIPWDTVLMIVGMSVLMKVAAKAELVTVMTSWISASIPRGLIPVILCLIGGCLSFFAGAYSVVCMLLFPMICEISAQTGLNAYMLFSVVAVAACGTGISPLSVVGSLHLVGIESEEQRQKNFNAQFVLAFVIMGMTVALEILGVFSLFQA